VRGVYDRPTVLKRWRDGLLGDFFFQKRVPRVAADRDRRVALRSGRAPGRGGV